MLSIPLVAGSNVKVDGVIGEEEWADGTLVPVAAFSRNPRPGVLAWAWLKYDAESLQVAYRSNVPGPYRADVSEKDGNVWDDESFELLLQDSARGMNARTCSEKRTTSLCEGQRLRRH